MVAFCALAAIVTKVGFWLIAIIIAGRGRGEWRSGDHDLGTLNFGKAVLMRLVDVQFCCGEGESRRSAGVCLCSVGVLEKQKQTPEQTPS